jgi:Protein of unknown function (DUF2865)
MTAMRIPQLAVAAAVIALSPGALAQSPQQPPSPACQQLVGQLTALDRGNSDPTRADQIHRAQDAVNQQQFQVDKLVSQARRLGCGNGGFFSIFSNPPRECGALNARIGEQRDDLDRMQNQLEQLQGGTTERAAQRQSLLIALANNGCGEQYRDAARAGQQGGFFDRLFGGNGLFSAPSGGQMGNTYRTVCVRTCDGYYFPIHFETTSDHFRDDEATCQRMCPAAQVQLYTYHNPGEEMSQAVSLDGRLYTELPTAFQYRKALSPTCACRRPGESWYEALQSNGPDRTLAPGDVVITDRNAKTPAQPAAVKPGQSGTATPPPVAMVEAPGKIDPTKRKVRTVGPTFLPQH